MKFTKLLLILSAMFQLSLVANSQNQVFTTQDSLRGSITAERAWWDLTFYHLDIKVSLPDSSFEGANTINYKVLAPSQLMQIDLQQPM
ncbi:MAG TPA: hypothetical protein PKN21_10055, partial [Bacteroidales bacterium]|nr:hypothetical protein [Bacteroidales bacterium]